MTKTLGGLCAFTMLLFIFGAAIVTTIANTDADENVKYKIIETMNGPVRGQNAETLFDGKKYYSYRGIPYAKAPTGDLRFKVWRLSTLFFICGHFCSLESHMSHFWIACNF